MTAIDVIMTPTADNNHVSIANWVDCINFEYLKIFNFFQHCIDQNLILNKFDIVANGVSDITSYYAVDLEKAEIFQKCFENQPLNFSTKQMSMKQFWNKFEFDIDIKLKKINIDDFNLLELVSKDTGEIWTTKFPLITPYDNHGNLQ